MLKGQLLDLQIGLAGLLFLLPVAGCVRGAQWNLRPVGRIEDPLLIESSGIVASRRYNGVFWTHNDDGSAQLFAIDGYGSPIRAFSVEGAENYDWEDIAVDPPPNNYYNFKTICLPIWTQESR